MGSAILIFENVKLLLIVVGIAFIIWMWVVIQSKIESDSLGETLRECKLLKRWKNR